MYIQYILILKKKSCITPVYNKQENIYYIEILFIYIRGEIVRRLSKLYIYNCLGE